MKQVLFVHGGEAYDSYEAFIADMSTWKIDPFVQKKKWRMSLREDLGPEYQVLLPEMPNKQNAKYAEWKLLMDKYSEYLEDEAILVGHSLGGIFLVKYLSEKRLPVSIRALYLVSAPFFTLDSLEGGSFRLDLEKIQGLPHKVPEIVLFHAKDDPVVPFSHSETYALALPGARIKSFEEGGHFIQESFPELIEDIKSLG